MRMHRLDCPGLQAWDIPEACTCDGIEVTTRQEATMTPPQEPPTIEDTLRRMRSPAERALRAGLETLLARYGESRAVDGPSLRGRLVSLLLEADAAETLNGPKETP